MILPNAYYTGGSVSAPFTGTAYTVKYFKLIPKEINQDTSQQQ